MQSKPSSADRAEMLKETIRQLYSNEGRSKSYISRLLQINRKTLTDKISEWKFPEPEPRRHANPSTQKFINSNRSLIKSRLDHDVPVTKIAEELHVSRDMIYRTVIPLDSVLSKAHSDYIDRLHKNAEEARANAAERSSRNYFSADEPGEEWRSVKGYDMYDVSNHGRVRKYAPSLGRYYLLSACPNKSNGRLYITLHNGSIRKNLQLARIVAHAFVDGFSETNCTVNHIDGDVSNNSASNLEWVSQSENDLHAYRALKRRVVNGRSLMFREIVYQDTYRFKTVSAFARFLSLSDTQARRYLDHPEDHNISFVR